MTTFISSPVVGSIFSDFDLIIKDFYRGGKVQPWTQAKLSYPIDIFFLGDANTMAFDIAVVGAEKEDIEILTSGDTLRVTRKKQEEDSSKENISKDYIARNINRKSFDLSWKISKYDLEKMDVKLDKGILSIRIPRSSGETLKRVEIK